PPGDGEVRPVGRSNTCSNENHRTPGLRQPVNTSPGRLSPSLEVAPGQAPSLTAMPDHTPPSAALLSIGEVARRTGLTTKALRHPPSTTRSTTTWRSPP